MKAEIKTINEEAEKKIKEIRDKYALKKNIDKEKPKRKTIPKSVKDTLWDSSFGREAGVGDCYCCKKHIYSRSFHAGHIVSVHDGGNNNIDNLKPICAECNLSMGTQNLEEFKNMYYDSHVESMECDMTMGYNMTINSKYNCKTCMKAIGICNENNYNKYRILNFSRVWQLCEGYRERMCRE